MNIDQPDGSSDSADGDNATTPPDSPPPPHQPEEEVEEAAGAAGPSFTAMPALADVGEEGEDLRYSLYISLMHGYNVGLRYIDERLAAPPPPPVAEEEIEQVEEGSTPPSEEIPYEQIEERSDEIPYEHIVEGQPEEEVGDEDTAAVNMAVDAAIRAVASDTSLAREEEEEKSEPEPPPPKDEPAKKVTVHMYETEETRTIGSPPSYRRPETPRATNSKGSAWNYASSSVDIVLLRAE